MSEERKKDPNELGAAWRRESSSGKAYMTGYVEIDGKRTNLVFFSVSNQNPKAPHWRILKSQPREQDQRASERAEAGDVEMGQEDYE